MKLTGYVCREEKSAHFTNLQKNVTTRKITSSDGVVEVLVHIYVVEVFEETDKLGSFLV